MKKTAVFISFFIVLISCDSIIKKKYTLIIHHKEKSILGNNWESKTDSTILEEETDSSAYYYGKLRFELGIAIDKEYNLGRESYDFEILNENRENIKYKLSNELITKLDSTAIEVAKNRNKDKVKSSNNSNEIGIAVEETPQIKELKKHFIIKKDEFDENSVIWYKPKSAPSYRNANGLYCYFGTQNGIPTVLRIVNQYYSDDWLFIRTYKFSIDGKAYSYSPMNMNTDNGNGGMIWEWSDEVVDSNIKEIIESLIISKTAKIKLEGKQYYDTKTISSTQIKSIKQTIELFKLMGGNF